MTGPSRWEFRWEPDAQIVAAVLSMPKASWGMTDMADVDRCWLVAGLGLAGMTAERIDEQLRCSLRLVRTIRAEPATLIAEWAQVTVDAKEDELRVERCDHSVTRRELADSRAEAARVRAQLEQLLKKHQQILDALQAGTLKAFPRCGHPKTYYNTYKHGGHEYCRECRRGWDSEKRPPKMAVPPTSVSVKSNGQMFHPSGIASAS